MSVVLGQTVEVSWKVSSPQLVPPLNYALPTVF